LINIVDRPYFFIIFSIKDGPQDGLQNGLQISHNRSLSATFTWN